MKRVVALILALLVCLGLCACEGKTDQPSEEEVKRAIIQSYWFGLKVDDEGAVTEYVARFLNNYDAYLTRKDPTGFEYTWKGTYEITNDQIIITDSLNEVDFFIDYDYSNGEVYLALNDRGPYGKNDTVIVSLNQS